MGLVVGLEEEVGHRSCEAAAAAKAVAALHTAAAAAAVEAQSNQAEAGRKEAEGKTAAAPLAAGKPFARRAGEPSSVEGSAAVAYR